MAETIEDLDVVTLIRDLQEEGLPAGQAGTVVFVHNGGAAFEVEFMLSPRRSVVATVGRDYLLKLKGLNFSRALSVCGIRHTCPVMVRDVRAASTRLLRC